MTDPANPKALPGVKVTVAESTKGGTPSYLRSHVTDSSGFVPLNVREIIPADDPDKNNTALSHYEAWGSVTATLSGYRAFEEEEDYFISGMLADEDNKLPNTVYVTMARDDGSPYLSKASFDGLDVLYHNLETPILDTNSMAHVLDVTLRNAGGKTWDFSLLSGNTVVATVNNVAAVNGVATAQFTGTWLDGKSGFAVGSVMSVGYAEAGAATGKKAVLKADFIQGTIGGFFTRNMSLAGDLLTDEQVKKPGSAQAESNDSGWINLPEFVTKPNDSMLIGAPISPIQLSCLPTGQIIILAQIGVGKAAWGGQGRKFNKKPGDFWQLPNPAKQERVMEKQFQESFNSLWESYRQGGLLRSISPITSAVSIAFDFQLQGIGASSKDKEKDKLYHMTFDFSMQAQGAVSAEFTLPFKVTFIPMYVGVDFSLSVFFRELLCTLFEAEKTATGGTEFSNFRFKGSDKKVPGQNMGPFIGINAEAGFSLALGIKGLLAAGIRAYGYIKMSFDFTGPNNNPDYYFPQSRGIIGARVQVFVQFLFFKKTWNLVKLDERKMFERIKKEQRTLLLGDDGEAKYLLEESELTPVGENELLDEFDLFLDDPLGAVIDSPYKVAAFDGGNCYKVVAKAGANYEKSVDDVVDVFGNVYSLLPDKGESSGTDADCFVIYSRANGERYVYNDSEKVGYAIVEPDFAPKEVIAEGFAVRNEDNCPLPEALEPQAVIADPYDVYSNGGGYNPINGINLVGGKSVIDVRNDVFSDARLRVSPSLVSGVPNKMCHIAITNVRAVDSSNGENASVVEVAGQGGRTYTFIGEPSNDASVPTLGKSKKKVKRSRVMYSPYVGSAWDNDSPIGLDSEIINRANRWDIDYDIISTYGKYTVAAVVTATNDSENPEDFKARFNSQYVTMWVKEEVDGGLDLTFNCDNCNVDETDETMWSPRVTAGIYHVKGDPRAIEEMTEADFDFHVKTYFYAMKKDAEPASADSFGKVLLKYADILINAKDKRISTFKYGTCQLPDVFSSKYHLEQGVFTVHQYQPVCNLADAKKANYTQHSNGKRLIAWSCPKEDNSSISTVVFWNEDNPASPLIVDNVSSFTKIPLRKVDRAEYDDLLFFVVKDGTQGESKLMYAVTMTGDKPDISAPVLRTNFSNFFCDQTGERVYMVRSMNGKPVAQETAVGVEGDGAGVEYFGSYGQYSSDYAMCGAKSIGEGRIGKAVPADSNGDEEVSMFQVLRADRKLHSVGFWDFYPYFKSEFSIDDLAFVNSGDGTPYGTKQFITASVEPSQASDLYANADSTDPVATNTANLRMLTVPTTQGMQVDKVEVGVTFCAANQKVPLRIYASNTGMRPINKFTMIVQRLDREGGSPVGSTMEVVYEYFDKNGCMAVPTKAYAETLDKSTGEPVEGAEHQIDPLLKGDMSTFYPGSSRIFTVESLLPIDGKTGDVFFSIVLGSVSYGTGDGEPANEDPGMPSFGCASNFCEEHPMVAVSSEAEGRFVNILDMREKPLSIIAGAKSQEEGSAERNVTIATDLSDIDAMVVEDWVVRNQGPTKKEIKKMDAAALDKVPAKRVRRIRRSGGTVCKLPSVVSKSGHKVTYKKQGGSAKISVSKSGAVDVKGGLAAGRAYRATVIACCGNARKKVTIVVKAKAK